MLLTGWFGVLLLTAVRVAYAPVAVPVDTIPCYRSHNHLFHKVNVL
ncbi:hypothetical protein SeD_B0056 (plasmid) [Salmonella enterica subsp. enterica serovar Dublin str. CT_02021853]|uniref:Uncharacterized protein n=3 Tax=Salmonella dublin TaxID=98360 RepID=F5BQR1_SALDU|nr:hypothetical protein SeD_B0056 [Salmonella enterica subsp. enterica serovar Dublin str. CT_02021853]AEA95691.1 hypothetical protein pSD853_77_110 [Salmonella enterica subsp. enterica serovar Dublin]EGE27985.1 hypothetical protein SD3246_p045 [Salmonella enterica subsp. enterica serovar Dublin str. SD3246]